MRTIQKVALIIRSSARPMGTTKKCLLGAEELLIGAESDQSKRRPNIARHLGLSVVLIVALSYLGCATGMTTGQAAPSPSSTYVTYATGEYRLQGRLCKPEGKGPFPAVVYNHGGYGDKIGGAPDATCVALANAGFVGFSPIRRPTRPFQGHPQDVAKAIDYVAALPYVDSTRLGLIGFSSGATVTYLVAARRKDLKAVVIMGTAGAESRMNVDPSGITAPVLVLVAKNDTGSKLTSGNNTVASSEDLVAKLKQAGRNVTYIVYPPYRSDGHQMFFEIGAYWTDVVEFLKKHL
jgi:dienelactone hydrolase